MRIAPFSPLGQQILAETFSHPPSRLMACNLAVNNFAHPVLTGLSKKDSMLFGCFTAEDEAVIDDALGELLEEEIVWGEVGTHHSRIDFAASNECIYGKVGTKINSGGHQAVRHRSMLSMQIEMQADMWAPGSTLSAVFVGKQSAKDSGHIKVAPGHKVYEAEVDGRGEEGGVVGGLIPPHELVARQYAAGAAKSFSVLHGAGCTLKGMDLSRLRNEVWRQTGFAD